MWFHLFLFLFSGTHHQVSSKLNGEGSLCGRPMSTTNSTRESRVVGGYDVGYYKYSWYVALWIQDFVACGGSLVANKMVITAAHCYKEYVIDVNNKTTNATKLEDVYEAILGIYNKCEKEPTQKTYKIDKVHIHEKYVENNPYYDIALLVLKDSTEPHFKPICLPRNLYKIKPKEATVIGMGTLKYHGGTPCTLHEARILIYQDQICKDMLNRTGNPPDKLYGAFCAGYMQGGIDTCQGDSGGPLQIQDDYGNNILLGVVSFGFHCANPGLLGLYTDVSQYVNWIEEKTGMKASIEDTNSTHSTESFPNDDTDNATAITVTTRKPTKKPHKQHYFYAPWPGFWHPVNIFIYNKKPHKVFYGYKNKNKT